MYKGIPSLLGISNFSEWNSISNKTGINKKEDNIKWPENILKKVAVEFSLNKRIPRKLNQKIIKLRQYLR